MQILSVETSKVPLVFCNSIRNVLYFSVNDFWVPVVSLYGELADCYLYEIFNCSNEKSFKIIGMLIKN